MPTDEITVCAWIKADEWETEIYQGTIVDTHEWEGVGERGYVLRVGGSGRVSFNIGDGDQWIEADSSSLPSMSLKTWYLITGVFTGTEVTVFINEKEGTPTGFSGEIAPSTYNLYIGRGVYAQDRLFDGCIDEVMIFDRALQQSEIAELYTSATELDGAIVRYDYDFLSARIAAHYGNGTTAEYDYDMADRLLTLENQIGADTRRFDYTYDNVGNRLSMMLNDDDNQVHNYDYDEVYRLTEVDYPDDFFEPDTGFRYDDASNRRSVVVDYIGTYYQRNSLNQYRRIGTSSYINYDDNGNRLNYGGSYGYDSENRMISCDPEGTTPAKNYTYDYLGRRVSNETVDYPELKVCYIYDGDQVICEYDSGGILKRKFVYGTGIDEVVHPQIMGQPAQKIDISTTPGRCPVRVVHHQVVGVVDRRDTRGLT